MSLTLNLNECGKVTIQWKKSCGDFSYPPRGLSIDILVPQKLSKEMENPIINLDSFSNKNSNFIYNFNFLRIGK